MGGHIMEKEKVFCFSGNINDFPIKFHEEKWFSRTCVRMTYTLLCSFSLKKIEF